VPTAKGLTTQHWPKGSGSRGCICGHTAANPDALFAHMRVWWEPWSRVRFRQRSASGEPVANVVPGHRMTFKHSPLSPEQARVVCSCGIEMISRDPFMGIRVGRETLATQHAQQVIRQRCEVR